MTGQTVAAEEMIASLRTAAKGASSIRIMSWEASDILAALERIPMLENQRHTFDVDRQRAESEVERLRGLAAAAAEQGAAYREEAERLRAENDRLRDEMSELASPDDSWPDSMEEEIRS